MPGLKFMKMAGVGGQWNLRQDLFHQFRIRKWEAKQSSSLINSSNKTPIRILINCGRRSIRIMEKVNSIMMLTHTPIGWTIVVLVVISGITAAVVWRRKCRNVCSDVLPVISMRPIRQQEQKKYMVIWKRLANYNGLMRPVHMDYLVYADYLQQNEKIGTI